MSLCSIERESCAEPVVFSVGFPIFHIFVAPKEVLQNNNELENNHNGNKQADLEIEEKETTEVFYICVAGGGGSSKSGIKNGFDVLKFIPSEMELRQQCHVSTGNAAIMNCSMFKKKTKWYFAAGLDNNCFLYEIIKDKKTLQMNLNEICNVETAQKSLSDDAYQKHVLAINAGNAIVTAASDGSVRLFKSNPLLSFVQYIQSSNNNMINSTEEILDIDFDESKQLIIYISKKAFSIYNVHQKKFLIENHSHEHFAPDQYFRCCRFGKKQSKPFIFFALNSVDRKNTSLIKTSLNLPTKILGFSNFNCRPITAMEIFDVGDILALGTADGSIKFVNCKQLKIYDAYNHVHGLGITCLQFLVTSSKFNSKSYLVAGSADCNISVIVVPSPNTFKRIRLVLGIIGIALILVAIILHYKLHPL